MSMAMMVAMASRKRDDRGRYMDGHDGHPMDNYSMDEPEMRRRRDSRGRYMEDEPGPRMAYDGDHAAMRPWREPHIPPYLDRPGMMEDNIRPGRERRMDHEPYVMRDRNVVNIRDYQDKRRIGFGENRMHDDDDLHGDHIEKQEHKRDGHWTGYLTTESAKKWVDGMQNADPEHPSGAKWSMETTKPMAIKHGFSTPEKQLAFWAVMNMMYSDYCEIAKKHGVSSMEYYADMAKAWMRDKDAVEDKTAAYIECCTK